MLSYPIPPLSDTSDTKIEGGCQKGRKKKFSELGLPGVEILNGACRSILHLSRGSQLPYSEKSKKSENLPIFLFALFSPYFPGLEVSYRALWYMDSPTRVFLMGHGQDSMDGRCPEDDESAPQGLSRTSDIRKILCDLYNII